MQEIIEFFGSLFDDAQKMSVAISTLAAFLVAYRGIYRLVGIFFTRKFSPAKNQHKYGVLIAARNEEAVIGNLLSSIKQQDYPHDKLTVFVVADNCTDKTAQIARENGAICYERFDDTHRTKGYALQFLLDRIGEDYGRLSFEGYFVFDADNLLSRDYVAKMNDAFDSGAKIITSYRNSKNFDENWIASTYALHWLRSVRHNHRARSVFRLATNIQGTGFLFSNEIVKDGWKYTSLTEDRALTADAVAQGYQITYQDAAVFYDEQPTSLKIALRQRLRWSKGHLQAFIESGGYLFLNIFLGKTYIKTRWGRVEEKERNFFKKMLESLRHRFASFDTLMQLTPFAIVYPLKWLLVSVLLAACMRYSSGVDMRLFGGTNDIALILRGIFGDVRLSSDGGIGAMGISMLCTVCARLIYRISVYFKNIVTAVYIFIIEHRRIKKIPLWKKALFCFTWPTFDIIDKYTKLIAIFVKVTWKPIPHTSTVKIEDINNN